MFEFIIQSIQTFISPLVILLDISIQCSAPCTQDVITTLFWSRNIALISTKFVLRVEITRVIWVHDPDTFMTSRGG